MEAQRLFKEARILFGTADYTGALELLTEAYRTASKIADEERRSRILHVLQVNLSQAHVEAWKVDADLEHLRIAKSLLTRHLAREEDEESESRRVAELLMERIDASLDRANEDAEASATPLAPPVEGAGAGDAAPRDRGKMSPMKIAGYTALACSGLSLGIMGGGMAIAASAQGEFDTEETQAGVDGAERRGKTGNIMAIAGGASAGAFAATGVVLLVLDKKRRVRAGKDRVVSIDGLAPLWSRQAVGFSLGGRF